MSSLNLEDLMNIFGFLSPEEVLVASRVCVLWNEAANTSSLWRRYCLERWSFCNLVSIPGEQTWKRYFKTRYTLEKSMKTGRPGKDYTCKTLRGHSSPISDLIYVTPNMLYDTTMMSDVVPVVASCAKEVVLWNVRDGKPIHKFDHEKLLDDSGHNRDIAETAVGHLAFEPDHSWLASADGRGIVHVLDTKELKTVCVMNTQTHISCIKFVTVSTKGTGHVYLCVLTRGGHFQVWDVQSPEKPVKELDCTSLLGGEGIIEINRNHLVALSSKGSTPVDIFDLNSLNQERYSYHALPDILCTITQSDRNFSCVKWHPLKPSILVGGFSQGEIVLWDIAQGGAKCSSCITPEKQAVTAMDIRGSFLLVGTRQGLLVLVDVSDEKSVTTLHTFHDHIKEITGVFADPYHVLTCSVDYSIRVYRWHQEIKSDTTSVKNLQSCYTLLGGSLQRAGNGFKKAICDYSSCVGLADNNTIKLYTFPM